MIQLVVISVVEVLELTVSVIALVINIRHRRRVAREGPNPAMVTPPQDRLQDADDPDEYSPTPHTADRRVVAP